jgi:hypothetical protein
MNELLAPNGKPSNLTPEQYKLVRTPAFKEWFGDWEKYPAKASKVIDENGEPLVVWRGVKANNYDYQKQGYNYFAKNKSYGKVYGDILHPFFLNIRNPLDLEFFNKISSENGLTSFNNEGLFQIGDLQLTNQFENETTLLYLDDLNDVAEKFNYLFENGDGIIGYDTGFYGKELVFVTKHPNQVKLADGTNTTFDENNDDIRFDGGGQLKKENNDDIIFVRTKNFDNTGTFNKLPYNGIQCWAIYEKDLDKYIQELELWGGKKKNVEIINPIGYDIFALDYPMAHKYVMGESDEIPKPIPFNKNKHTMKFIKQNEKSILEYISELGMRKKCYQILLKTNTTFDNGNSNISFDDGGEVKTGLFAQIWEWFGIKF